MITLNHWTTPMYDTLDGATVKNHPLYILNVMWERRDVSCERYYFNDKVQAEAAERKVREECPHVYFVGIAENTLHTRGASV